jgi:lysyl-tRNA synthetase class 2
MTKPLDQLRRERLRKLERVREAGIDPYPSRLMGKRTAILRARESMGQALLVAGRIMAFRRHGRLSFADVRDESGEIQLQFKKDLLGEEQYGFLNNLDIGDFLAAEGKVVKTRAGEISVAVSRFQLLTKSIRPLPSRWHGFKDTEERYRKRYLDMILNPDVKEKLRVRGAVIAAIRRFLDERGFVEVETPTLQPVYGGGFARPFVTRHQALGADFYLRISDEMYLKRLVVGGFEKVYEITKVFRNEGIDRGHNPEFTMFEAMIAFRNYRYGMEVIEEIVECVAKEVLGTTQIEYQGQDLDFKRPWKRHKLVEALASLAGIDPLGWRTVEEAREAVSGMKIAEEKLKNLPRMQTVGEIIAFAFEEVVEKRLIQPTIIYDYPVEVSPLAKKCDDPRFTQRFEMFAAGMELGNNYSELNDPLDLKKRFVEEKKREKAGFAEAQQTDDDYLTAVEYGFPPTCGIAIGIDRLVMVLTDSAAIREVIAFPTLKPGPA